MNVLDELIASSGRWIGTNTLQDPESNQPEESAASATVTPTLGGRFVRLDYTWGYRGVPQEGSLLIGFDRKANTLTAHWIDTWHMSDLVMACAGPRPGTATFGVQGAYAAPPGPDWGWRIEITPRADGTLHMIMFNLWPDGGREDVAAEASYQRA